MLSRRTRPLRPALKINQAHYIPSSIRSFHVSSTRKGVCVDLAHSFFQNVHTSSGLSWAGSIFLSGVLLRLMFTPISWWSLIIQKRTQDTMPLRQAHSNLIARIRSAKFPGFRVTAAEMQEREAWTRDQMQRRTKRIQDTYNIQSSWVPTGMTVLYLPLWLVSAGVMQAMSGLQKGGWLSYILNPATLPPPEPAFATEGIAWVPMLSSPDPLGVLPIVLGGLIWLTMRSSTSLQALNLMETKMKAATGPQKQRLLLQIQIRQAFRYTPLFCLLLMNAPSSLPIFMCGSAMTTGIVGYILKAAVLGSFRERFSYMEAPAKVPQVKSQYAESAHQMDIFRPPNQKQSDALSPDISAPSSSPLASRQDGRSGLVARAGVQKGGTSSNRHLRM